MNHVVIMLYVLLKIIVQFVNVHQVSEVIQLLMLNVFQLNHVIQIHVMRQLSVKLVLVDIFVNVHQIMLEIHFQLVVAQKVIVPMEIVIVQKTLLVWAVNVLIHAKMLVDKIPFVMSSIENQFVHVN